MNQVIETIVKRRSIRFFQPAPIDRNDLEQILTAGNHAPSGGGAQSWRFVVAQKAETRKKLAELALPRYKKWMENAPAGLKAMRDQIDAVVKDPVYYSAPAVVFVIGKGITPDFDCAMVCENMMIAAASLGIGSCWVHFGQLVVDDPAIRAEMDLQEGEKIYGPIVFGYPQENQPDRLAKKAPVVKWI